MSGWPAVVMPPVPASCSDNRDSFYIPGRVARDSCREPQCEAGAWFHSRARGRLVIPRGGQRQQLGLLAVRQRLQEVQYASGVQQLYLFAGNELSASGV